MDTEIDKVLSRFQERNRQAAAAAAHHQIRLPREQLQVEDDEAGMDGDVYERLNRLPLENANAEGGVAAVGLESSSGGGGRGRGGAGAGGEGRNINGARQQQPQQDKHHTMGLAQPLKFEAGKAYKRRQKMMDAAVAAAAAAKQADSLDQGQDQDQVQGVKGLFNAAADDLRAKLFPSSQKKSAAQSAEQQRLVDAKAKQAQALRHERVRLVREDRIEKRLQSRRQTQMSCRGPGAPTLQALSPAELRKQVEEEDDAAVALGIYDDGEEVGDLEGNGKDLVHRMYLDLVAQNALRKKMSDEEKEVTREDREKKMKKRRETKEERDRMLVERMRLRALAKEQAEVATNADEAEEVEEEVEEGDQEEVVDSQDARLSVEAQQGGYLLLQQQQDNAYYGSDGYDDDDEGDEQQEVEMRGPPISVGSAEELERVLEQLQEEGICAEVVRGSVTETIEAAIVTPVSSDGAIHDEQYDNDGGYNYDSEKGDEEEGEELTPPIAVKNAEELASVLERLVADGVRAEVVQGDLTRYVEPPMASV